MSKKVYKLRMHAHYTEEKIVHEEELQKEVSTFFEKFKDKKNVSTYYTIEEVKKDGKTN